MTVFYGSATLAHKADFHDLLEPALAALVARFKGRIRVVLRGHFGPMTVLDPHHPSVEIAAPTMTMPPIWIVFRRRISTFRFWPHQRLPTQKAP